LREISDLYDCYGAAASDGLLHQPLDHDEHMIQSNLALGVQSSYRRSRFFETGRSKAMVNPMLKKKGMLVVFNPVNEPVTRKTRAILCSPGPTKSARIRERAAR